MNLTFAGAWESRIVKIVVIAFNSLPNLVSKEVFNHLLAKIETFSIEVVFEALRKSIATDIGEKGRKAVQGILKLTIYEVAYQIC